MAFRVVGFNQCNPTVPRDDLFHDIEKGFPFGYPFPVFVFHVAERLLHGGFPLVQYVNYIMLYFG